MCCFINMIWNLCELRLMTFLFSISSESTGISQDESKEKNGLKNLQALLGCFVGRLIKIPNLQFLFLLKYDYLFVSGFIFILKFCNNNN